MQIRIITISEDVRLTERGVFEPVIITRYTVDDLGPFTIQIRKEEYSPELAKIKIEEEAKKIAELREKFS